jgi:dihydroflavonol-4-reductase
MELWSRYVSHKEPQGTVKAVAYVTRSAFFDPTKARRELGFPSTPLRTSVERAVRYFREQGMV